MPEPRSITEDRGRRGRTVFAAAVILVLIPLVILFGMAVWGNRKYYLVSALVLVLGMLPFVLKFEHRRPQARELVLLAVMIAIGVAGRAITYMLPQCKPVLAIVILTGVAFGAEAGFVSGAAIAFLSNFFFGQGPWTPWQMFGFGVVGFLAGLLFAKGRIPRKTPYLCIYGALATLLLYGALMDTATLFMFTSEVSWQALRAALVSGVSFNLIHAAATVVFLLLLSKPLLKKLERVRQKYGLMDG